MSCRQRALTKTPARPSADVLVVQGSRLLSRKSGRARHIVDCERWRAEVTFLRLRPTQMNTNKWDEATFAPVAGIYH